MYQCMWNDGYTYDVTCIDNYILTLTKVDIEYVGTYTILIQPSHNSVIVYIVEATRNITKVL